MDAIEISLGENVTAALQALLDRGGDMSKPMLEISGYLRARIEDRFKTETDPEGVPWKRSRRAERLGGQTLTERAHLRNSMASDHGPDFAAAGPIAGGPAAPYAAAHQFGYTGPIVVPFHARRQTQAFGERLAEPRETFVSTHIRRMNLPARRYLGFSAEDGDTVVDIILPWLAEPLQSPAGVPA